MLPVPLDYELRIPQFEIRNAAESVALWWDPAKPRTISLGKVHSDLEIASTFMVTMPDAILYPGRGTRVAEVALRSNGKTPASEAANAGLVRYGPIDMRAGEDVPLELVITPRAETGWQSFPATEKIIDVEVASALGMKTKVATRFQTIGPPLLGRIDRHARKLVSAAVIVVAALILLLLAVVRISDILRFRTVRAGTLLPLGFGSLLIGNPASNGSVAMALPNSGSQLDDNVVAHISLDGRRQRVESVNESFVVPRPYLGAGDLLLINDPSDEDADPSWELEYVATIPGVGGEIEVRKTPAAWTLLRVIRRLVIGALLIWIVYLFLASDFAAALAYRIPFIESLYLRLLR